MTVGQRVKAVRLHFGLEQSDFAEKLRISQSALSKIENDTQKISLEALSSLVIDFEIDTKWLLAGIGGDTIVFNKDAGDDPVPREYFNEVQKKVLHLQELVIELQNDKIMMQQKKIDEQKHQ